MRCVNELQITTLIVTGKGVYRVDFGDPRSEGGGAGGGLNLYFGFHTLTQGRVVLMSCKSPEL